MNKKTSFNLLGAWHGRPRLRVFTAKPALTNAEGTQRH
jgi:hypothetical protein